MQVSDQHWLPMNHQTIWSSLNDPDVLRRCITVCESVEKTDNTHFRILIKVKVGFVSKRFLIKIEVIEGKTPQHYLLVAGLDGGIAGNANGEARVELIDDGIGTWLKYDANIELMGWLGKLESSLLSGTAKRYMHRFVQRFSLDSGC